MVSVFLLSVGLLLGSFGPIFANGAQFTFSARDLPSMDIGNGAPDAYINIYYAPSSTTVYQYIGRPEDISNNRNPDWPEIFDIPNNGKHDQMLKFDVYDADSPDPDDYMGYVEILYSAVLNDSDGVLSVDITGGEPGGGKLIIKLQRAKLLNN